VIEARGSQRALIRAYNLLSYLYGSTAARLEREAVNRALSLVHLPPGQWVLDVAVGTGANHRRLRQRLGRGGRLLGVDISPRMLRVARRRLPTAQLVQANGRVLPFPSESFDLLWSSYFLDLIPTPELTPVLREFSRVLKLGGCLLLVNFSKNSERLTYWERFYQLTPSWLVPYLFGGCRPVEAAAFVRNAGFVDVTRQFLPGGLDSEIVTARKPAEMNLPA
jgi:ubiquinone/menaquinone biosynthesis C-methylase UbiE